MPEIGEYTSQFAIPECPTANSSTHGEVVERRCTPFIGLNDSAEHLVAELTTWLKNQGGKAKP